ncbi:MAG: ribonuclease J [Clostridia bacterium]|nr:ribonuclease J [Clostridia bacterium]
MQNKTAEKQNKAAAKTKLKKKTPAPAKRVASKKKEQPAKPEAVRRDPPKNAEPPVRKRAKAVKSEKKTVKNAPVKKAAVSELSFQPYSNEPLRIAFLGGINEIGKNLTLFEYDGEMVILDCGMTFPDADMPGIDYVLPDFSYIERNKDKIKAVFITHGHEDHIGGLPYLLKIVNVPIYASCLTMGLIEGKLREHRLLNAARLNTIQPGDVIDVGAFSFEAIHVNHSIPDSLAFAIRCGAGLVVHTGDFKVDNTPINGGVIDLAKFAELGSDGVLCLMQDSTNAEKAGYTPSEKKVGETLEQLFVRAGKKRIIVASFASNIHRVQQIVDASQKMNRKIFLSGRSLENVMNVSRELGFISIPDDVLVPIDNLRNYRDEDTVIITTGSQGEPMSALARMATGDHRKVNVGANDFVIISATPIPGNEKSVANTINELMKFGAEVIYEKSLGIHVSGHAAQEELKLIMNLVRPKFFIPVHGEQKHMRRHAQLAVSVGIPEKNILVPELGSVIRLTQEKASFEQTVPAGRIYVDGSGFGDVGKGVLLDRKKLSTDGVLFVSAAVDMYTGELLAPVDIQTKGFVFIENANELYQFISQACEKAFIKQGKNKQLDAVALRQKIRDTVQSVVFEKTRRSPIVLVSVFSV